MSVHERPPDDADLARMHRILLKVRANEIPTAEELAFLREIKVEVLRRFTGPSMRVDPPEDDSSA